jgi:hypothetical protein
MKYLEISTCDYREIQKMKQFLIFISDNGILKEYYRDINKEEISPKSYGEFLQNIHVHIEVYVEYGFSKSEMTLGAKKDVLEKIIQNNNLNTDKWYSTIKASELF